MEVTSSTFAYILDFLAGVLIILSIILRSKRQILVEAETLYDGNPLIYESQLNAFWDGWIGTGLLFSATLFHIFHFDLSPCSFALSLTLLLLLLVAVKCVIRRVVEKEVRKRYKHYDNVMKAMKEGKYDTYP